MRSICLMVALFAFGCSSDSNNPPPVDSPPAGAFGSTCTVVSDTSTECDSGVCTDAFDMLGHPVCSVKCTFGNDSTCPSGSSGMKCNMKGFCKP